MSIRSDGGTPPRGRLTGPVEGLTKEEKAFAEEHLAKGDDVRVIPTGSGRAPDFSINGGPAFELKTVCGVKNTTERGLSSAISSRIMDGHGQSGNVVIDARAQANMTNEAATLAVRRAVNADKITTADRQGKLDSITILTPEGQVTWRR